MASGMGMPSMGIYSYELFHTYDVDNIIRVGSVGSISPRLKLRDVVLGQAACTDSNYPRQYGLDGTFSPIADFTLLESAVSAARRLGVKTAVGNLLSSDVFYRRTEDTLAWGRLGVLAVEMESAALYCNAAEAGKRALAVCTVSDNLLTGEALSTTERQTSFTQMITLALEVAVDMAARRVNRRGKSRPSGRLFPRETIREDITPVGHVPANLVDDTGLEPVTSRTSSGCSTS